MPSSSPSTFNLLTRVSPLIPPFSDFECMFSQCHYGLAPSAVCPGTYREPVFGTNWFRKLSPTVQGRASMPQTLLFPTVSHTWASSTWIKGWAAFSYRGLSSTQIKVKALLIWPVVKGQQNTFRFHLLLT